MRAEPIVGGLLQGLIAYLILVWLAPQWQGNLLALVSIVLLGGVISAIVFGLVRQAGHRANLAGFLIVSCLLPPIVVLGADSAHYGRPYFAGPLTLGFILLWVILLLLATCILLLIFNWAQIYSQRNKM